MTFQEHFEKPALWDYVCTDMLRSPDFKDENGLISIENVLDADALYRAYPWVLDKVKVILTSANSRALNGEQLRIITVGGGEGVIHIAKEYYEDGLDGKDPANREALACHLVHEIGHAVDDYEGNLEYQTREEIERAEEFADSFMKRWCK